MVSLRSYSNHILLLIVLLLVLILPVKAHFFEESKEAIMAEELTSALPKVSLLPDSFFYFLKTSREGIQGFFIVNLESEIGFRMDLANKRLSELVDLIHKNQGRYIEKALEREGKILSQILVLTIKAQDKDLTIQNLDDRLNQLLDNHKIILFNIEDDVPKSAKAAYRDILNVIDQK